jgi:hypothetical protein
VTRKRQRAIRGAAIVAVAAGVGACGEQLPILDLEGDLPIETLTLEVRLPWEEFGSDLQVWGTYGLPQQLPYAVVAHEFGDSLESRGLMRVNPFPETITAPDTNGVNLPDSLFTVPTGRVVLRIDTIRTRPEEPVTLVLETLPQEWDARTATWDMAVDTVFRTVEWEEPGAGPVTFLGQGLWDPSVEGSDSVVVELDSAAVAVLNDSLGALRGFRIRSAEAETRLRVTGGSLRGDARPSFNPDTTVALATSLWALTFIHSPELKPQAGDIVVGGAPAVRSVFSIDLPAEVTGDEEFCSQVKCPFPLDPDEVVLANLVLTGRAQERAFAPVDTLLLDIRPVVNPDLLPRAPLGEAILFLANRVPPEIFNDDDPGSVQVNLTFYIRDLLKGETAGGNPVYPTVVLHGPLEPLALEAMRFSGPEGANPPELRLLLTVSEEVKLR